MKPVAESQARVVIIGAGFAGLWAATALSRCGCSVLILNRNNYHAFPPLLYQVAAAEIEPEQIAYPLRSVIRKWRNVKVGMVEVLGVDFATRTVHTSDRDVSYDYLILSIGATTDFFGVPGAAEHAYPLKTLVHSVAIRNQILCRFESAMREPSTERRLGTLVFTIVGGGATGVEFAGALAELIQGPFRNDYPNLEFGRVRVVVVEGAKRLLSGMPEPCGIYALERLKQMGVDVMLGSQVQRVEKDAVYLSDGTVLATDTVIWTAGVQGDPVGRAWGLRSVRGGRLEVTPALQLPDHPEVYVAGDLAYVEEDGQPLPMTAPVATQQGVSAAANILRQIEGQEPASFVYKDKGAMVTIGRNAAVARIGKRYYFGFFAWILWLAVHIFNLIGFRNRLFVLVNWSRDYFLRDRAVRLIMPMGSESPCGSDTDPG
jgi:NADH:ubiquinone reductase (H+-translocating)